MLAEGEFVLNEITPEAIGDKVRFWGCTAIGEIVDIDREADEYYIEFDDGELVVTDYKFDVVRDTALPRCNELYAFTDASDEAWSKNGGLDDMSKLGFRIYESLVGNVKWTYVFGMDGGMNDITLEKLYLARAKMKELTPKSA